MSRSHLTRAEQKALSRIDAAFARLGRQLTETGDRYNEFAVRALGLEFYARHQPTKPASLPRKPRGKGGGRKGR